ncbi:uncharacterized protein LOC129868448 isoform X4 [Salvelinus fontinalis]|uniref:uncharacterized protein LOC129868448 isoform X4 n=1 Tax=Salvelinus fontinalis TaxID=8038 RepID=UPI002485BBF7|nr:uncharacterized protein LOC129868448 isoform X4 [Salvelinus fontinalis]
MFCTCGTCSHNNVPILHFRTAKDFNLMRDMKMKMNSRSIFFISGTHAKGPPLLQRCCVGREYKIDPCLYSPYFSLGACMEGLNMLFSQLLGVSFQNEQPMAGEAWSEDLRKMVREQSVCLYDTQHQCLGVPLSESAENCCMSVGSQAVVPEAEGLQGYIYCDFFRRPDKPHQAFSVPPGLPLHHPMGVSEGGWGVPTPCGCPDADGISLLSFLHAPAQEHGLLCESKRICGAADTQLQVATVAVSVSSSFVGCTTTNGKTITLLIK